MKSNNRITNLDFIRGISVLGILIMNSLSFSLPFSAYFNHPSAAVDGTIDWVLVFISEIFVSQKMMGLFSVLFGAGIVIFIDSANKKNYKRPRLLSIWRNSLLFLFGIFHALLWDGDILRIYGISAILIIFLYKKNIKLLVILSLFFTLFGSIIAYPWQGFFDSEGNLILSEANINIWPDKLGLSSYWFPEAKMKGEAIYSYFGLDATFRAIGMMLLGVILFRSKVLFGNLDIKIYKKMTFFGLALGIPLGILSLLWLGLNNYSPDLAIIGFIPNKLGIIPMTIAYIGMLSILNKKLSSKVASYIRACGRMAFTNYITQTLFCYIVLNIFFKDVEITRKEIFIFVLIIWAIQLIWSKYWLDKFKYGPLEFIWRKLTYYNERS
ncbi:MAG: DUF418 domain-containing protein [Chloroflexi bacterium]|nr:DUF418 domain-containing protein [Chloroflexota bacterium]